MDLYMDTLSKIDSYRFIFGCVVIKIGFNSNIFLFFLQTKCNLRAQLQRSIRSR